LKIPELEYYESEGKTITNIIADKNIPLENSIKCQYLKIQ
jgi:hypothetical protein